MIELIWVKNRDFISNLNCSLPFGWGDWLVSWFQNRFQDLKGDFHANNNDNNSETDLSYEPFF